MPGGVAEDVENGCLHAARFVSAVSIEAEGMLEGELLLSGVLLRRKSRGPGTAKDQSSMVSYTHSFLTPCRGTAREHAGAMVK